MQDSPWSTFELLGGELGSTSFMSRWVHAEESRMARALGDVTRLIKRKRKIGRRMFVVVGERWLASGGAQET
jgi:hypothetical protein